MGDEEVEGEGEEEFEGDSLVDAALFNIATAACLGFSGTSS